MTGVWIRRLNVARMPIFPNCPIWSMQSKSQQGYLGAVAVDKLIVTFLQKCKEPVQGEQSSSIYTTGYQQLSATHTADK